MGRVGPHRADGRGAVRDVGLPFIDPADIAEVAATVLRTDGHAGHVYELTGPVPVSPRQRAQAIGEALGEPVRFVEQTRDTARTQMLHFMPEPVVESTLTILGEPSAPELRVSPSVKTGTRPAAPHLRRLGRAEHRRVPMTVKVFSDAALLPGRGAGAVLSGGRLPR